MAKKVHNTLLIVESPAKARTIERYLGTGYTVAASMGHLIDLPKSRVAVDVENDFEPEYITVRGKAKILKELLSKAGKAEHVLLASDNDREGEAISYHLRNALLKKRLRAIPHIHALGFINVVDLHLTNNIFRATMEPNAASSEIIVFP